MLTLAIFPNPPIEVMPKYTRNGKMAGWSINLFRTYASKLGMKAKIIFRRGYGLFDRKTGSFSKGGVFDSVRNNLPYKYTVLAFLVT